MKKIILLAGLVAGGVAFSATAFANGWLFLLLLGSDGNTKQPAEPNKLLLFLPAILAGSQGGQPPVVTGSGFNDTGIILDSTGAVCGATSEEDCNYGRDKTDNDSSDGHAGFSFTKLDSSGNPLDVSAESWSCVQDNVTGLVWSSDQGTPVLWAGTETLVISANASNLCGKTDWRLPEVRELFNIISYDADSYTAGSTVDTTYFANTQVGASTDTLVWYWTATAVGSGSQWGVTFQPVHSTTKKSVSLSNTLSTAGDLNVHPVRLVSGTAVTSNFTEIGDGSTIQDNNTGLIWKSCLEGQDFSNGSCINDATTKTWPEALALDDGTWRVPNIKELQSIVGGNVYFPTPTIDTYVWSSSPYAGNTDNPWVINFKSGLLLNVLSQNTAGVFYVRLVRDAPTP
jgi:hypothetical protein